MTTAFIDRVSVTAETYKPARMALTALAAPFYALGFLVGVLWVIVAWAAAAVMIGVADARERSARGAS